MKRFVLLVALALTLPSCAALPSILAGVAQGAQLLGSAIDAAQAGSDTFFDRHPSLERERAITKFVRRSRHTTLALNEALAYAEGEDDPDIEIAKKNALDAYTDLREALLAMGVLDARAPDGGAETDAPRPTPFELPTPEQVRARL